METVLERLENLRDNNPDIAQILEEKFPEIQKPFVKSGDLFMRSVYQKSIYVIIYDSCVSRFRIKNVRDNKYWNNEIDPSNPYAERKTDLFLTMGDFNELLRKSGTSLDYIKLISVRQISRLHDKLFFPDSGNSCVDTMHRP